MVAIFVGNGKNRLHDRRLTRTYILFMQHFEALTTSGLRLPTTVMGGNNPKIDKHRHLIAR